MAGYQTTLFSQIDPDVELDPHVLLIEDPRWNDGLVELAKAPWICVDTEFHGPNGPWGARGDIDYWKSSIRLIQAGLPSGNVLVFDLGGLLDDRAAKRARHASSLNVLKKVVENPTVPKAGMYLSCEYLLFRIHLQWRMRCMRDMMLMSQVVWAGIGSKSTRWTKEGLVPQPMLRHNMAAICERLEIPVDKTEQLSDWAGHLTNRQINYAARDVIVPRQAWVKLSDLAKRDGLMKSIQAECDAQPAFCECSYNGLPVDIDLAREDLRQWEKVRDEFLKPFTVLFPNVNPSAPGQVATALTNALDVYVCKCGEQYDPLLQEPKGQPLFAQPDGWRCRCGRLRDSYERTQERSFLVDKKVRGKISLQPETSDEVLTGYTDVWYVNALLEGRSTSACMNWLKAAVENAFVAPDGGGVRIRADFRQIAGGYAEHGSVDGESGRGMGRSSASRPINTQNPSNLQPAHKKAGAPSVRRSIRPRAGRAFIVADLSQAHWRIAAQWSQDPIMLRDCQAGRDAHLAMTHRVMVANGARITFEEAEIVAADETHPLHREFKSRRQSTKSTNYASLNMSGVKTLQRQMATMPVPVVMDDKTVKQLIDTWVDFYRVLRKKQKDHIRKVNANTHKFREFHIEGEYGESRAMTGRRLFLVKEWQPPRQWEDGTWSEGRWSVKGTDAVSSVWMMTESDIVKRAMGWLVPIFDAHPEWDVRWSNMAHDEIDLDCAGEHALPVATVVQTNFHEAMRWAGIVDLPVDEPGAAPEKLIKSDWSAK